MIRFPLNTLETKQIQFYLLLHVSCFLRLFLSACSAVDFLASHFPCLQVITVPHLRPKGDVRAEIRVHGSSSSPVNLCLAEFEDCRSLHPMQL